MRVDKVQFQEAMLSQSVNDPYPLLSGQEREELSSCTTMREVMCVIGMHELGHRPHLACHLADLMDDWKEPEGEPFENEEQKREMAIGLSLGTPSGRKVLVKAMLPYVVPLP